MAKTFSLDSFKEMAKDNNFASSIIGRSDIIDFDNGTMTIYSEHLNKYLEKYMCKDIDDLENTLWFNYGVFVRVVE